MKISLTVAAVLTCVYGALLGYLQAEPLTPIQTYWKTNRNAVATYSQSAKPPVVFTGSSLTWTLGFNEATRCVYNLGLIGESALTGLDVIAESAHKPHTVFVEINFPERESNRYLINEASGFLAKNFPEFTYTPPVNFIRVQMSKLYHSLMDKSHIENSTGTKPDSEITRQTELELNRKNLSIYLPDIVLSTKILEFKAKVNNLEKKGIKVIFFEMPVHPELENSKQVVQVRAAFRGAFPDNRFIGFDALAKGVVINPADGLHLNVDGAKGVIANLRNYYVDDCARNMVSR